MPFPKDIPLETIMDSLADGVFTVDLNWTITFFNRAAAEITGIPAREAIGRKCHDVFQSSICDGSCALKSCMEDKVTLSNKSIHIVRPDGKKIPLSISAAPLLDRRGRVAGGVETFRDLSDIQLMRKKLQGACSLDDIITRSRALTRTLNILPRIAASQTSVLLLGESGTGKELFARAIHNQSPRKDGPFVAINCGALPETLMESELFGYKKGAFTDARSDHLGRFETAQGGTILLDEIGDMPLRLQVKLLRVLQEKTFEPLGSTHSVPTDVRIIAATNLDLDDMVASGRFRPDLYYRLSVARMSLPPLRERPEDILLLANHFIEHFNALHGVDIQGPSEDVVHVLLRHAYPGNVRELRNILEYASLLCSKGFVHIEHLPEYLHPAATPRPAGRPGQTLRDIRLQAVQECLQRHDGRKMAACRELDISKDTLRRILSGAPRT
ncbi:sigma-54 interaction domain-containing protein [Solidesulfovibrio magneticus]|uniref:Fis family transcriptional regulator n=1 Tax=Solidesulfovibrio magneticus (strain ATCC 700980 / DSM 13731 / RS-1) TaxID=573370 RepID=C4XPR3_SOLM1|nr:sigma 54-interacting transcriptional regulator [Solidesulfovibrio magneticus]BAH77613.1 fis family transcriptional regulator [Solidesulfovibrio magneticus RS-1]